MADGPSERIRAGSSRSRPGKRPRARCGSDQKGPGRVLSYMRERGRRVPDGVHIGDCRMAGKNIDPLTRDEARRALRRPGAHRFSSRGRPVIRVVLAVCGEARCALACTSSVRRASL
ncbi:DUF6233 domain-containing protein [Streptomyces sp. NPDC005828]|uniref:DUF6233 domain-containing protein n=1 Tax=Streptomyces sp. NPDC005828 TaxID=3157071 RepID=UPI003405F4A0